MADNNKRLLYKPAVSFYEKEIGISHTGLEQVIPVFIKEKISQNILNPIADVNKITSLSWPMKIINNGIRFQNNFDNNTIIQIRSTTNQQLIQTVKEVVNEVIMVNNIKRPKLILIFACCIFDALLSKTNIKEIELLKKQDNLINCKIVGTYVYGEIGMFEGEITPANGSIVCLVIGDELRV
jgi:hypothetical protein